MPEVLITKFQGLSSPYVFGNPATSRYLTNTYSQYGRILGRDGYAALSAALSFAPIGLFNFNKVDGTAYLLAMDTTNIYNWTAGAFSDISGAFVSTGASTDFGDSTLWVDDIYMSMRTMKVARWTGTGNVSFQTAPTARCIENFEGYMFAGYAEPSTNGTVANQDPQIIRYTTAPTGTWATTSSTININQTTGLIMRLRKHGRVCYVYKNDAIVAIRFVGGTTVFDVHQVPFGLGLLAVRSLGAVGNLGHFLLATDGRLYLNAAGNIQPLRDEVNTTLLKNSQNSTLSSSIGVVDTLNSTYSLLYPNSSGTMARRLMINWITGEFTDYAYSGATFSNAVYSQVNGSATNPVGNIFASFSADSKVYTLDSGLTDGSTAVSRAYRTDWQDMGTRQLKKFRLALFRFKPLAGAKVAISIATDVKANFSYRKIFSLNNVGEDDVEIFYQPDVTGKLFDLKIEEFPVTAGSDVELRSIALYSDVISRSEPRAKYTRAQEAA